MITSRRSTGRWPLLALAALAASIAPGASGAGPNVDTDPRVVFTIDVAQAAGRSWTATLDARSIADFWPAPYGLRRPSGTSWLISSGAQEKGILGHAYLELIPIGDRSPEATIQGWLDDPSNFHPGTSVDVFDLPTKLPPVSSVRLATGKAPAWLLSYRSTDRNLIPPAPHPTRSMITRVGGALAHLAVTECVSDTDAFEPIVQHLGFTDRPAPASGATTLKYQTRSGALPRCAVVTLPLPFQLTIDPSARPVLSTYGKTRGIDMRWTYRSDAGTMLGELRVDVDRNPTDDLATAAASRLALAQADLVETRAPLAGSVGSFATTFWGGRDRRRIDSENDWEVAELSMDLSGERWHWTLVLSEALAPKLREATKERLRFGIVAWKARGGADDAGQILVWRVLPAPQPWISFPRPPKLGSRELEGLRQTLTQRELTAYPAATGGLWSLDFSVAHGGDVTRSIGYAARSFKSDRMRRLILRARYEGGLRIWMNDALVLEHSEPGASLVLKYDEFTADVRTGDNTILVEVSRNLVAQNWRFALTMLDEKEKPLDIAEDGRIVSER